MAGHNSRYKTLLNSSDFPSVVRRLHFTGSKLTIICSLMTTLKTCIRTITYLSDIGCLEIQGASLKIPSRLSILVAISWSLILKKAVTAKPEYEEIFEMMHSSAFINAAKGTIF